MSNIVPFSRVIPREKLPYALCWFFGSLLAVVVPALVYMELAK